MPAPESAAPSLELPNKGSAFDPASGKFFHFVRFGIENERATITVTRYWPDPRSWVKEVVRDDEGRVSSSGWKGQSPRVSVEQQEDWGPKTREEAGRMYARFRANLNAAQARIPEDVRAAVELFAPKYHWAVLNLLARAPGFTERAKSQPVLVLAVAKANYFKAHKIQRLYPAARRLQHRRSTEILRWLDWPAPKSAAKLMGRIEPTDLQLCDLFRLRSLMRRGEPWVRHLPRLNRNVLLLLDYHRSEVSYALVAQAAAPRKSRRADQVVRTLRRVKRWLREAEVGRGLPVIRDLDHLHRLARQLARGRAANRPVWPEGPAGAPELRVPPPPFAASLGDAEAPLVMRPLLSGQEIYAHAKAMKNCLAHSRSHLRPISAGRAAAYEVRWAMGSGQPDLLCTAFLLKGPNLGWKLSEIAGVGNDKPPDWLTQKVWNWVAERSPKEGPPLGTLPTPQQQELLHPDQLWIPF